MADNACDSGDWHARVKAPSDAIDVCIFRSPRIAGMFLYVPTSSTMSASTGLEDASNQRVEAIDERSTTTNTRLVSDTLPPELLQRFGEPVFSFSLALWPHRPLAQADAATVLATITRQGFYLQMPPQELS